MMTDRATTLLEGRREHMERTLGRALEPPDTGPTGPLAETNRGYLLSEAQDLYWNELEWEKLTEEEALEQGPLTELIFPGLLAYVRGLLLTTVMPDSKAPPSPRPQIVEELLDFLASRIIELEDGLAGPEDGEDDRRRHELEMTSHLVDLVLYQFHELRPEDIERLEAGRHASA